MPEVMNRKAFYDVYREAWGPLKQSQVNGIEQLLDFNEELRWPTIESFAYALATVKHECADTWQPIEERDGGDPNYFDRYEPNTVRGLRLGNTKVGDGAFFKGRGYVQLTGRANYTHMGLLLGGVQLVTNPDLALVPETAYLIMQYGMLHGLFTGAKLSTYLNRQPVDFRNARRVINALDKADLVASYAQVLLQALKAALDDAVSS